MTASSAFWTYALAPDVKVEPFHGGVFLRTAISQARIEAADEIEIIKLLQGSGNSEAQLQKKIRLSRSARSSETVCAALLYRLDRLGFLARGLSRCDGRLASCVPLRPPPTAALPQRPPEGRLRLSRQAIVRASGNLMCLEVPGSWAKMIIYDRELLALVYDLAGGRHLAEMTGALASYSNDAICAVIIMMSWCALLDGADHNGWRAHDLLFHARTRTGYARVLIGKTETATKITDPSEAAQTMFSGPRLSLQPPDMSRLFSDDPPYAAVAERRRSSRRQGLTPISLAQLSEFLFRTLCQREGRRPYPSGGACYPLQGYVAVHRCVGVPPGLYAYDPLYHALITLCGLGPGLDRLLADAATAANVDQPPQILLILATRYSRTHRFYGDLSYSLILKEVGAVLQAAMMAAAAMGLGTCPLGCGNSLLFSTIAGLDPLVETSVGELMLGTLDDSS
jgi:oxazoline/thiazoline dehydrogenase